MCVVLYIASDVRLPLVPFNKDNPAFNVTELPDRATAVRQRFSKPYVYEMGSHTGCGCGFQHGFSLVSGQYFPDTESPPGEVQAGRESRRQLALYLRNALAAQESIQLFACWAGDEGLEAERKATLAPEDLIEKHPCFIEFGPFAPEFLTVVRD